MADSKSAATPRISDSTSVHYGSTGRPGNHRIGTKPRHSVEDLDRNNTGNRKEHSNELVRECSSGWWCPSPEAVLYFWLPLEMALALFLGICGLYKLFLAVHGRFKKKNLKDWLALAEKTDLCNFDSLLSSLVDYLPAHEHFDGWRELHHRCDGKIVYWHASVKTLLKKTFRRDFAVCDKEDCHAVWVLLKQRSHSHRKQYFANYTEGECERGAYN